MTIREKIGKAIVQIRKTRGLSQEAFAYEAQVDRRYMSDVENGKRNLSVDVLMRIVRPLGITLSTFFAIAESIDGSVMTLETLKQYLREEASPETIVLEQPDFIHSVIGVSADSRVVYSYEKMVEELMATDGLTYEEAIEYIDYNTIRSLSYMGKYAPIIVYRI